MDAVRPFALARVVRGVGRWVERVYSVPAGPASALSIATVAAGALPWLLGEDRLVVAVSFLPSVWVLRVVVLLFMRIPQAQHPSGRGDRDG